jgi:3-phosphoshikimate 1-carboxyvinyltransferase
MSRTIRIKGKAAVRGRLVLPGDKSISHRVAMLASVARGKSIIEGFATSADCAATLDCIERLGVRVEREAGRRVMIEGRGLYGYATASPEVELYAANSGSTMRMLSGLLAGQSFRSVIDGDASLRRRPMARIIEPLRLLGAHIEAREGNLAPLVITGRKLRGIDYTSKQSSAQVKSCVLLAGLYGEGRTIFKEPAPSRNHTELMLKEFGANFNSESVGGADVLSVEGGKELKAVSYTVPGDPSSAAFFIAASTLLPDSNLTIKSVNLNPSRTAFIEVLKSLGANITLSNYDIRHGEPSGDLHITTSWLAAGQKAVVLSGGVIANLIDEIPILAVVGTQLEGRLEVRDARELRVKESDRIRSVVEGVRNMGGLVEELEDGLIIEGPQRLRGGVVESAGDHRVAMAFAVAGLVADGVTEIRDADCVDVSFPGFFDLLAQATGEGHVLVQAIS